MKPTCGTCKKSTTTGYVEKGKVICERCWKKKSEAQ